MMRIPIVLHAGELLAGALLLPVFAGAIASIRFFSRDADSGDPLLRTRADVDEAGFIKNANRTEKEAEPNAVFLEDWDKF